MTNDILNSHTDPDLPWIFRLPFRRDKKETNADSSQDRIRLLTRADLQYTGQDRKQLLEHF